MTIVLISSIIKTIMHQSMKEYWSILSKTFFGQTRLSWIYGALMLAAFILLEALIISIVISLSTNIITAIGEVLVIWLTMIHSTILGYSVCMIMNVKMQNSG
jgi:hypothetical protein